MGEKATGTFTIDTWEDRVYDEREGATLGKVHVEKTFEGALKGTGTAELLTVLDGEGNPAVYVAVERFTGTLDGRPGTFVLHHTAPGGPGERMSVRVVPGTATGELIGLTGTLTIDIDDQGAHSYTLEHDQHARE
ncbi:DUF3224 domain-containing protein [Wenjunlia tyrosinilytica]|uniref:DUF3224 domain-containing protein n=1 Tax=Wenjunlia tyrosinilytica TaxID=1544741 RepID=A0A918DZ33_9ACTN|nr:DUF3224 domain-containing protein [Wenjunlia tyrosinilytica]GGO89119.1 hypothetical protein GCM10012280_31520 [Wenjunlia tyrosinilytica]